MIDMKLVLEGALQLFLHEINITALNLSSSLLRLNPGR